MYGSRGSMWAWSDIDTSPATAVECTCSRVLRSGLQTLCIKRMRYIYIYIYIVDEVYTLSTSEDGPPGLGL